MEQTSIEPEAIKSRALPQILRIMSGNIMILSITDLLGNFSRRLVFPYVSLYILALGGNATEIGYVSAVAPLLGLLMFPLSGYIADHASRVRLIVLSNCLVVILVVMRATAPSWEIIALASFLQGLAVIQFPARSALIADALLPSDRGRGIALMNTVASTLAIFAPYCAGIIVDHYGPNMGVRLLYAIMAIFYVVMSIIHLRFLKEPPAERTKTRLRISDLSRILKDSYGSIPGMLRQFPLSLKALTGVIILTFMANGVASAFWVVYAVEEIGLSSTAWGLILLIETVLKLLMFIPAGMIADRWGRTTTLLIALLLSLVSMPAFAFATDFTAVLSIRAILAVAFALAIPACTALMADMVPRQMRGRVMSAIGQGSIMIGPAGGGTGGPAMGFVVIIPLMLSSLAGGYLYDFNPVYPWFFVMGTTALAILLTIFFVRDPHTAEV